MSLIMDFLNDFGVQPILLAAQIVNFLVLLFILKKLLYKPILKVLKERRDTIAQSLKNTEEIEKKLLKTEEERQKVLDKTTLEAKKIIEEASKSAELVVAEAHVKAQQDINGMVEKGRQTIVLEREKMQQEIREELSDIVTVSLKKIITESLDPKKQKEIVDRAITKF